MVEKMAYRRVSWMVEWLETFVAKGLAVSWVDWLVCFAADSKAVRLGN